MNNTFYLHYIGINITIVPFCFRIDVFRVDGEEHCVSDKGTLTYTTDPTQPAVYNGSFTCKEALYCVL